MSNRYDNKWVQQIVDFQHEDGSWGLFSHAQSTDKGTADDYRTSHSDGFGF